MRSAPSTRSEHQERTCPLPQTRKPYPNKVALTGEDISTNFGELRKAEVRRILFLGTPVNKGKKKGRSPRTFGNHPHSPGPVRRERGKRNPGEWTACREIVPFLYKWSSE